MPEIKKYKENPQKKTELELGKPFQSFGDKWNLTQGFLRGHA